MQVSRPSPSVKDGYHHGDLRKALLDAAATLLAEGGVDAVSVREAARRLGVSPRAPYQHFRDKESLLSALAIDAFEQLGRALVSADDAAAPGQEVEEQAIAYVQFAQQAPARFQLMFGPRRGASDSDLGMAKKAAFAVSERRVRELSQPGDDAEARIVGYWSFAHGLAGLLLDTHLTDLMNVDIPTLIRRATRATLSRTGATPEPGAAELG